MEYRDLGKSDIKLTEITFGAWAIGGWMWGGADKKDALAAIRKSLEMGITSFDTAPVYGFGTSEDILGEALSGKRQEVQILTKFGLSWDTSKGEFYFDSKDNSGKKVKIHKYAGKNSIINECEQSLKRLKTDYIDLYQIHWSDSTTPIDESMEAIYSLMKEGKVKAVGVCNYSAAQMKEANDAVPLASNQVPYSMVLRDIEEEVVPFALKNNIGILAYSPLQRGLLTGKITKDYKFEEGDHRPNTSHFKPHNLEKTNNFLNSIKPLADDKGATLAQIVINWTIHQPGITSALVGARNARQVEENAKARQIKLSQEEMEFINNKLNDLKLTL
ncbi:MAG: aldo/keto reductase [Bacteroidota bacterium]|nr:aldo/keto reductase [Bacteroidota bacterium]